MSRVMVEVSGDKKCGHPSCFNLSFIPLKTNQEAQTASIFLEDLQSLSKSLDVSLKERIKLISEFVHSSIEVDQQLYVPVASVVFAFLKALKSLKRAEFANINFSVISNDLPIGCGLGSSAAFNVASAASLLVFTGVITPNKETENGFTEESLEIINECAFEMEQFFHGTPSGVDNSTSTYGGALSFVKGHIKRLEKFPQLQVLIVNTRVERNTKRLVESVSEKYQKFPDIFEPILSSMNSLADKQEQLLSALSGETEVEMRNQIFTEIKELFEINHGLLNTIGVGHRRLDECHQIANANGFACKLTGAGGGGCAIVLLGVADTDNKKVEQLKRELEDGGFVLTEAAFGCTGVKMEELSFVDS